jgi:N,N'-diacetyllegionaminate synthase
MTRPKLIAELAKCHNGSVNRAKKLIDMAKDSKFDIIKMQAYNVGDLNKDHANYARNISCHLKLEELHELKEHANTLGMDFWCSAFSPSILPKLRDFTTCIKTPGTFFSHYDFISSCMVLFDEVHISTGFSTSTEIEKYKALYERNKRPGQKLNFYHCISKYPTPIEDMKMGRMSDLKLDSLSYHGINLFPITMAYILQAKFIELHFNDEPLKLWHWTPVRMRKLYKELRKLEAIMQEKPVDQIEMNSFNFFRAEFNNLSSLKEKK